MPKPTIFVSRRVPDRVRAELEGLFQVGQHVADDPLARPELLARVAGCDGLVTMLTDRVDAELLEAAGARLRVVANYAVGYDNVDVEAATKRGVLVTNTPDVLTASTAELTVALMLALLRRISEGDRLVRRGDPWVWAPTFLLGRSARDRTLGVVGLGRIGREVARLASALGMRVAYTNRSGPVEGAEGFRWLPFTDLLARADVVTLHAPLTPDTRHLVGRAELRAMRRDAILVNTARGALVDEDALIEALREGGIAGAALDVYEREPEVPEGLRGLENVVLAPHLGSATLETRVAMGMLCVDALKVVLLEERPPPHAVNPEAWKRSPPY